MPQGATQDLRAKILGCTRCQLHMVGNGPVPFMGEPSSIMVVGEAPGHTEDREGRPFCGRAGELLWRELAKVGIEQDMVFTANAVSCFPDRTPIDHELHACLPNLVAQMRYCFPTYVLALGRPANWSMGKRQLPMHQLHGQWYRRRITSDKVVRVFPTYHPSAILRNATLTHRWRSDLRLFAYTALGNGET